MNHYESRLFEDLRISNFLKSWIIIYRCGFQDPLTRVMLMTGYKPWEEVVANSSSFGPILNNVIKQLWKFNELFCSPPPNELSIEEAMFEMKAYFKYWVDCTLNGESFDVFDTEDGRGLGIRATKLVSLGTLSNELPGFLEIIEYPLYA